MMALGYFLDIEEMSDRFQRVFIGLFENANDAGKKHLLNLLQLNRARKFKSKLYSDRFLAALSSQFNRGDDEIIQQVADFLQNEGDAIIVFIQKRAEGAKAAEKLGLLRIQWLLSSTKESLEELKEALHHQEKRGLLFAEGFRALKTKRADSETRVGLAAGHKLAISYVENRIPPDEELFKKYLSCDIRYIDRGLIEAIANLDPKYRTRVLSEAKLSHQDKKNSL